MAWAPWSRHDDTVANDFTLALPTLSSAKYWMQRKLDFGTPKMHPLGFLTILTDVILSEVHL